MIPKSAFPKSAFSKSAISDPPLPNSPGTEFALQVFVHSGRPPRLPLFDYRGFYRYFVTCCVRDRQQAFVSDAIVDPLRMEILHASSQRQFAILAYVFMPDHLHLLAQGAAPDADFRAFMRYLRRRTALEYRRMTLLHLWQDGYFERVLRADEATPRVIAYILENPVRAGLVKDWTDYPFLWTIDSACLSRT